MTARDEMAAKIVQHIRDGLETNINCVNVDAARATIADAMTDLLASISRKGPPASVMGCKLGEEPGTIVCKIGASSEFLGEFARFLYDGRVTHEEVTGRLEKMCPTFREFMCEMRVTYDDGSDGIRWMVRPPEIRLSLTFGAGDE